MTEIIDATDLPAAVQTAAGSLLTAMINGANAKASRVAPCLTWDGTDTTKPAPTSDQLAEAALILIGAVSRWAEAGAGAYQQQTAGPFSTTIDTRQRTGYNLWPSEIADLQAICRSGANTGAFSVDTISSDDVHSVICDVYFGGACSCGADIAGVAIY